MLDHRIQLLLRSMRDQGFLPQALETVAQQLVLFREAVGLPYRGPDQRQRREQDGPERKPLRARQRREMN